MERNGEFQFLVEILELWEVVDVNVAEVSINSLVAPSFALLHCFFDQHRAQAPVLDVTIDPDVIKGKPWSAVEHESRESIRESCLSHVLG